MAKQRKTMKLFCTGCQKQVTAHLKTGMDIYPHRKDLYRLPFWQCKKCKNYVGCHHKTKNPTKPMGNIPTPQLRTARKHIHEILDPLWKTTEERKEIYARLTAYLGREYHTAEIKSIDEARRLYQWIKCMGWSQKNLNL